MKIVVPRRFVQLNALRTKKISKKILQRKTQNATQTTTTYRRIFQITIDTFFTTKINSTENFSNN